MNLRFSEKQRTYFHIGELECTFCHEVHTLGSVVVIYFREDFRGKGHESQYCPPCINKRKRMPATQEQFFPAVIAEKETPDMKLVQLRGLEMTSRKTNMEVAITMQDQETIRDNTRYAGRESFQGASIGISSKDDGKDRLMFEDELGKRLLEMKDAEQVKIEYKEKKQLEYTGEKNE